MASGDWNHHEQVMLSQQFRNPMRVRADVEAFNRTQMGQHVTNVMFDMRRSKLRVAGTIPVTIDGAVYHIPIAFYLDARHPYAPPEMCVEPAPGMILNPAQTHVRYDGRVHHDCLTLWDGQQSTLETVCISMAGSFGVISPVNTAPAPAPAPGAAYPPPGFGYPNHGRGGGAGADPTLSTHRPPASVAGPPLAGQALPYGGGGGGAGGGGDAAVSRTKSRDDPRIQEVLRLSKQSAVHDNVARKIKSKLNARHARSSHVIAATAQRNTDLNRRADELRRLQQRGQSELAEVKRAVAWYTAEQPQIDMRIKDFEKHAADAGNPETAVVATHPLYGQYIRLHRDYNAIEETLLALKQVHDASVTFSGETLKALLYKISQLSREQFKVYFLMQRVKKAAMIA
mmetsp:Transcript_24620/g.64177  ORF Transcript_24620/g.64177 Transcript_24620/m.64177 type:complete len:399 (+) Transcript_24620:97-1293(+)